MCTRTLTSQIHFVYKLSIIWHIIGAGGVAGSILTTIARQLSNDCISMDYDIRTISVNYKYVESKKRTLGGVPDVNFPNI